LAPGKEIELHELKLDLVRALVLAPEPVNSVGPSWLWASGKVSVQYERVFGNSSAGGIKLDPTLGKLGTGKLELEIKSAPPVPPAATEKK
jgi:hypothetical protein